MPQSSLRSCLREIREELFSSGSTVVILTFFESLLEIRRLPYSVAKVFFVFEGVPTDPSHSSILNRYFLSSFFQ